MNAMCGYLQMSKEASKSPGGRVSNSCVLPNAGAGKYGTVESALSH